jgi:hypothetical protein
MDLLSLTGEVTRKRSNYFFQAEKLAERVGDLEKLESRMKRDSYFLVKSLGKKQIRREEFFRSLTDKTLTSALAAVYLATRENSPQSKMEKAWPIIIGNILPPLVEFRKEIEKSLEEETLVAWEDNQFDFSAMGRIMTWSSLATRVMRYLANPSYSFFSLGEYLVKEEQGYRQMRRVPRIDGRTCEDCLEFGRMGWQPIGTLPMPGQECRCYDRCRCRMDYR